MDDDKDDDSCNDDSNNNYCCYFNLHYIDHEDHVDNDDSSI